MQKLEANEKAISSAQGCIYIIINRGSNCSQLLSQIHWERDLIIAIHAPKHNHTPDDECPSVNVTWGDNNTAGAEALQFLSLGWRTPASPTLWVSALTMGPCLKGK